MIIEGETFSIKYDPVPNMGQVEFTYDINSILRSSHPQT